jgi:hypothetical protein
MNADRYPIIAGDTLMVYEFSSEGINGKVQKLVVYRETNLHNLYNLGFGDMKEQGVIDDEAITNNGDSQKVLATVAFTLLQFTNEYPDALVYATGSTESRTRLYRIGISNNLNMINEHFFIFGQKEDLWEPFQT